MSAPDLRPVGEDDLHAYTDDRLDPARRTIVEAWLVQNPAAAERVRADRALRDRLRDRLAPIAAEPIPARLRIANLNVRRRSRAASWLPLAAAIVVGIGVGTAGGWFGRGAFDLSSALAIPPMTRDAVAAYRTFVVEVAHPVEVRASDAPHLVQWLSRRIDHPLQIPDLNAQGFQLMGGRIVPAEDRPAALLMFSDASGTRLTLYARSGDRTGRAGFRYAREGDVAAFSWFDGTLSYVVTAKMSEARLLTIAQAIGDQSRSPTIPTASVKD